MLPYGGAPKIGSPVPAHPDFYLDCRACLMMGVICSQQELHSRAKYLTFQRSSQLITALPSQGLDHPAPHLARGRSQLCSWVTMKGPGHTARSQWHLRGWSPYPLTQSCGQGADVAGTLGLSLRGARWTKADRKQMTISLSLSFLTCNKGNFPNTP